MNIEEYKSKVSELEKRQQRVSREYDRRVAVYGEKIKQLKELGIDAPEQIKDKVKELESELAKKQKTLTEYIEKFEDKLKSIEEIVL